MSKEKSDNKNEHLGKDQMKIILGVFVALFVVSLILNIFAFTNYNKQSGAEVDTAIVGKLNSVVVEMTGGQEATLQKSAIVSGVLKLDYLIQGQVTSLYATTDGNLIFPQGLEYSQVLLMIAQAKQQQEQDATPKDINLEGQMTIGSEDAPVTVVEFSDYGCPYCGAAEGSNEAVVNYMKSKYPDWVPFWTGVQDLIKDGKVRLVYRELPLASLHPNSPKASEGAKCAAEQELFWKFKEKMYANQDRLNKGNTDTIKEMAAEIEGIDVDAFNVCLDSGKYTQEVAADVAYAASLGISGTPTFFVNGAKADVVSVLPDIEKELAN